MPSTTKVAVIESRKQSSPSVKSTDELSSDSDDDVFNKKDIKETIKDLKEKVKNLEKENEELKKEEKSKIPEIVKIVDPVKSVKSIPDDAQKTDENMTKRSNVDKEDNLVKKLIAENKRLMNGTEDLNDICNELQNENEKLKNEISKQPPVTVRNFVSLSPFLLNLNSIFCHKMLSNFENLFR